MEEECLKIFGTPNMALVAKGNRPRSNKNTRGQQAKKGSHPAQKGRLKAEFSKKQKTKGNGEKTIVRGKCHSCGKKGHYARDYPELFNVPFSTYSPELSMFPYISC